MTAALHQGDIHWAELAPVRCREQGGRHPVVIVSGAGYLRAVTTLAVVVPVTTTARGWPNQVELTGATGLHRRSWAMTEQIRTISRDRLVEPAGSVDTACLAEIHRWIADFLMLPLE